MSNVNETPLLAGITPPDSVVDTVRAVGIRQATRMMQRVNAARRPLTEPSMTVRETVAQEIQDRQVDWAYSRPVVILDASWNSAFIAVAVVVLLLTVGDSPRLPLRLWAVCYAVQCLVHVFCVCAEFLRRERRRNHLTGDGDAVNLHRESSALIRHLESVNTMFSLIWWLIGFYWILVGGHALQQDSPMLYWLCIAFLILDLFFVIFCMALASVIATAACCCVPCMFAILFALFGETGASKEDIDLLACYTFHSIGSEDNSNEEIQGPRGGVMRECGTDSPRERRLTAEDAECCICLSEYEDGVKLIEVPCGHHFHKACAQKWLYIKPYCPLCKFDVSAIDYEDGEV